MFLMRDVLPFLSTILYVLFLQIPYFKKKECQKPLSYMGAPENIKTSFFCMKFNDNKGSRSFVKYNCNGENDIFVGYKPF